MGLSFFSYFFLLFSEEFRLTACMSILKWACNYYSIPPRFMSNTLGKITTTGIPSLFFWSGHYLPPSLLDPEVAVRPAGNNKTKSPNAREYMTPTKAISMALLVCEQFLRSKIRDDRDSTLRVCKNYTKKFLPPPLRLPFPSYFVVLRFSPWDLPNHSGIALSFASTQLMGEAASLLIKV